MRGIGAGDSRTLREVSDMAEEPGISLLIVEDDLTHIAVVENELEGRPPGFRTTQALDCAEARLELLARHFDCILLDHHLPDGNAAEILAVIREDKIKVPVIIFTTSKDEATQIEGIAAGCTRFVRKHQVFKPGELHKLIVSTVEDFRKCDGVQAIVRTMNQNRDAPTTSRSVSGQSPRLVVHETGNGATIRLTDKELYKTNVVEQVQFQLLAAIRSLDKPTVILDMRDVEAFGASFISTLARFERAVTTVEGRLFLRRVAKPLQLSCAIAGLNIEIEVDECWAQSAA